MIKVSGQQSNLMNGAATMTGLSLMTTSPKNNMRSMKQNNFVESTV